MEGSSLQLIPLAPLTPEQKRELDAIAEEARDYYEQQNNRIDSLEFNTRILDAKGNVVII